MPPYLPKPRALVFLSGAIEIGLGSLMFFEETRSFGTLAITAFLVAVLPVHVYMLQERDRKFRAYPKAFLWARIPLQFVLMAWAMRYY